MIETKPSGAGGAGGGVDVSSDIRGSDMLPLRHKRTLDFFSAGQMNL